MPDSQNASPQKLSRVAIVAGEDSGDILGAGLIRELQKKYPECVFEGIGGAQMLALGFTSLYPLDRLAVMGLVEPLKRLPELLGIRKTLRQRYINHPPDVFIGIDAPDFNLDLEAGLRKCGIKTVHYVSPSVWAWRQGRVKKIAKAVDLMLTLFPFEAAFYRDHDIKVEFVGHPLADKLPLEDQRDEARQQLGLDPAKTYVALLPGSRRSELEKLCDVFLAAAGICAKEFPALEFLIPSANASRYREIEHYLQNYRTLNVRLFEGRSHEVMASADVVLMASGTTTLEAMLLKRPMVIAYRLANLSYWILKRLVKSKYIGLPNLLAGKALVPELIQDAATPQNLADELLRYLRSPEITQNLQQAYLDIHTSIKRDASRQAAAAIETLVLGDKT